MIEFFEAFYEGKIYTPGYTEEQPEKMAKEYGIEKDLLNKHKQPNEYDSSSKLFNNFLRKHSPFKDYFNSELANRYFREIRCGLLHEAATKGASLIKSKKENLLIEKNENNEMIVYRSNFQNALKNYLENYEKELLEKRELKINFIRKMDELSGIKRTYYFATEAI